MSLLDIRKIKDISVASYNIFLHFPKMQLHDIQGNAAIIIKNIIVLVISLCMMHSMIHLHHGIWSE